MLDGDKKQEITNMDETLLLVSGSKGSKESDKDYVKKLANAILQVFNKHNEVHLRCVGAASLNNAIKACIVAKGEVSKQGDSFRFDFNFTTVQFQGEDKTGIVLEILPG